MELDNGIQDEFSQNDDGTVNGESESQSQETELDLSQPLFEYDEGDSKVTLTGQEAIERLGRVMDLEKQIAELSAKANQPAPQTIQQFQPAPAQTEHKDPVAGMREQAQDALTRFANGDMDAIPTLLDVIGQFAEARAQSTTAATLSEQQRDAQFLSAHPDAPEAINGALAGEFATFRQRNPFYTDGVQAFLAFKADRATAAHQKEIADLKAQIAGAATKGKQAGEKETLRILKARGGIGLLRGGGTTKQGSPNGQVQKFSNHEDAAEAMKAAYAKMGGTLD